MSEQAEGQKVAKGPRDPVRVYFGLRGRAGVGFSRFFETVATKVAELLLRRLEEDNQLPLQERNWDVVVDDPDLSCRYDMLNVSAVSPIAANAAYREAMRREGFKAMQHMGDGDEQTLGVASECSMMYATVHRPGQHPRIDYTEARAGEPPKRAGLEPQP